MSAAEIEAIAIPLYESYVRYKVAVGMWSKIDPPMDWESIKAEERAKWRLKATKMILEAQAS